MQGKPERGGGIVGMGFGWGEDQGGDRDWRWGVKKRLSLRLEVFSKDEERGRREHRVIHQIEDTCSDFYYFCC